MKIAIITDTHFGARNDSQLFSEYFAKFYSETFFPYLKENDIHTVIHCGDVFDRRKYINYKSLYDCKRYFFDPLYLNDINCYMITGNHDTFYKSTNEVNALDLLLKQYDNITCFDEPTNVSEFDALMLPWICSSNYKQSMEAIEQSKSSFVFSHLELTGFEMFKGVVCESGMDPKIFDKFDIVFSGHFHHKSDNGTIYYLGNPYEMFWGDYKDVRGFHVFDTESREIEYIVNPNRMFIKLYYDDTNASDVDSILNGIDVANKYVKVIVQNKSNPYLFDKVMDALYKNSAFDISIIETIFDDIEDISIDEAKDTLTILHEFVEDIDVNVDKHQLQMLMNSLYNEALEIQ